MNLAKDSVHTFLFQTAGYCCGLISGMIIARILGPTNRGIITMTLFYPTLFSTLFNLTLGAMIVHHMGKKQYVAKDFAGASLLMTLLMGFLALSVYFVSIALSRETLYRNIDLQYLLIAGFAIPFYLMLYFFSAILQSDLDIPGFNIANQLLSYSNLFFIAIFTFFNSLSLRWAVLSGISGIVLGGVYSLRKALKAAGGASLNSALIRTIVKDSLIVHVGSIAAFTWMQANLLILNYYSTPSEVGYYSVAFSIANILMFFSLSLEIGLFPRVAKASMQEAVPLIQMATRHMLLVTSIAALVVALLAKYIVVAYGGKSFTPSATPLILLLPGVVIFIIHRILGLLWVRKGWFLSLTLISLGTAAFSLILNFLFIPRYGAKGASLATTLTYCMSSMIGLVLYRKHVDRNLSALLIPSLHDLRHIHQYIRLQTK